ncbi:hypothetical protein GWK47_008683 [Chionoecetes opilio]|uniref:HAT C-terminal dimerisation domain-containing protein n=1 Tax=Chionoecetes opilio TaxID=41210 RepID=A0A8J4Y3Z0_CHIOP|nr:hypothetical protein GWK47_008683 [Chionoecetes opilio]
MNCATKVCKTFQDLNVLATRMNRLYCFIYRPYKNPACATTGEDQPSEPSSEPPEPTIRALVAEGRLAAAMDDVLGFIFSIRRKIIGWPGERESLCWALQALRHKQNRKPTTAANIKREVGRKLRTPNVTRWNSLYDSMEVFSEGFKARFLFLFDQMNFLIATVIHLLFKLPVVRLLNPEKVDPVKSGLLFEITEQALLDTSEGSSLDEDEEGDCFKRNKLLKQAMLIALFRAAWVDVFVKYNTAIPSSAAVDRLFSQGSDIMKAKRASLTSDNFQRLVILKGNMDLLNMELSPKDSE